MSVFWGIPGDAADYLNGVGCGGAGAGRFKHVANVGYHGGGGTEKTTPNRNWYYLDPETHGNGEVGPGLPPDTFGDYHIPYVGMPHRHGGESDNLVYAMRSFVRAYRAYKASCTCGDENSGVPDQDPMVAEGKRILETVETLPLIL